MLVVLTKTSALGVNPSHMVLHLRCFMVLAVHIRIHQMRHQIHSVVHIAQIVWGMVSTVVLGLRATTAVTAMSIGMACYLQLVELSPAGKMVPTSLTF